MSPKTMKNGVVAAFFRSRLPLVTAPRTVPPFVPTRLRVRKLIRGLDRAKTRIRHHQTDRADDQCKPFCAFSVLG